MKYKILHYFLFFLCFYGSLSAQITTLWTGRDQSSLAPSQGLSQNMASLNMSTTTSGSINEYEGEETNGLVTDSDGNIYFIGSYKRIDTLANSDRNRAIFVYKYNSLGTFIWKRGFYSDKPKLNLYVGKNENFFETYNAGTQNIAIGTDGIYVAMQVKHRDTVLNHLIEFSDNSGNSSVSPNIPFQYISIDSSCKALFCKIDFNGNLLWNVKVNNEYNSTPNIIANPSFNIIDMDVSATNELYALLEYEGKFNIVDPLSNSTIYSSDHEGPGTDSIVKNVGILKFSGSNGEMIYQTDHFVNFEQNADQNDNPLPGHIYAAAIEVDGTNLYLLCDYDNISSINSSKNVIYKFYNGIALSTISKKIRHFSYRLSMLSKFDISGTSLTHSWTKMAHSNDAADINALDVKADGSDIFLLLNSYGYNTQRIVYNYQDNVPNSTLNHGTFFGSSLNYNSYNLNLLAKIHESSNTTLNDSFTVNWIQVMNTGRSAGGMFPQRANSLHFDPLEDKIYTLSYSYFLNSTSYPNDLYALTNPVGASSTISSVTNLFSPTVTGFDYNIIVNKFNLNGTPNWGTIIGGPGLEIGQGMVTDDRSNLIIGGFFSGQSDFDPTPAVFQLFSISNSDAFIAKYGCWSGDIVGDSSGCVGEFVNLSVNPECTTCSYNYEWTNINTGVTVTSLNYNFSGALGTNRVLLKITENGSGCITYDSIDVRFNSAISVSASPNVASECIGSSTSFTASVSPNVIGTTYSWYAFGSNILLGSSASFSTSIPGAYTVVASSSGCDASFNVNFVNYSAVSPRIVPAAPTICGSNGSLIQIVDCPGCSYSWTTPPLSTALSSSSSIIADIAGTYEVDILDQNNCVQTLFINVTNAAFLNPPITAQNANGDFVYALCNSQPLVLSSIPYTTCPTCTYRWSDGTTGPYTFAFSPGNYNVTVTDLSTGCIGASSSLNIQNSTLNSPTITANPQTICGNNPAEIELNNPCVGCTYNWINNTFNQAIGNTNQVIVNSTTATFTSSSCIPDYDTMTIPYSLNPSPGIPITNVNICDDCVSDVIDIGFDFKFYCNNSRYFRLSSNGFVNFDTSSFNNGCCSGQLIPNSFAPNNLIAMAWADLNPSQTLNDISYSTTGSAPNRIFTLNFINVPFYFNSGNVSVQLKLFEVDNSIELHTSNITMPFFYQATQGLENQIGSNAKVVYNRNRAFFNSNNQAFKFRPQQQSTVTTNTSPYLDIYMEMTDSLGCTSTSNIVTITEGQITPPTVYSNTTLLCGSNTATIYTDSCLACTYEWYRNDTLLLGFNQPGFTTSSIGVYKVRVGYANSCSAFSSNVISLSSSSFAPSIGPSSTVYICNGDPITIGMQGFFRPSPLWSYQWYRDGVQVSGETGYNLSLSQPGTYFVQVTNASGCISNTNSILAVSSALGANPGVTTLNPYLCSGRPDTVYLSTSGCSTCFYDWRNANNVAQLYGDSSIFAATQAQGYFVRVTEQTSGCVYESQVFQVLDTIYPTATINAISGFNCSQTPVILSTNACVGCNYIWYSNTIPVDTTTTNTFSATVTGNYSVRTLQDNCPSPSSIDIPVSVVSINAALNQTPSSALSICNGDTIIFSASPLQSACPTCSYLWVRNGIILPNTDDSLFIQQGGNYYVVITKDGCRDTSLTKNLFDVTLNTQLSASALKICGPSASVTLQVANCPSCTYNWQFDADTTTTTGGGINYTNLGSNLNSYTVNGYAARGIYRVQVTVNGCMVMDSIYLDTIRQINPVIQLTPNQLSICDSVPIQLMAMADTTGRFPFTYQWNYANNPLSGAITQSYLTNIGGAYSVTMRDVFGCEQTTANTLLQNSDPPVGFNFFLDSVRVIPLSYPNIPLDSFIRPLSVVNLGNFISVPQPSAVLNDTFFPALAGSGRHLVTYTYNQGVCSFSSSDTIEILTQQSVDVVNIDPIAPIYEACTGDTLRFILNNFTFSPEQILFPTSSTTFDTIRVNNTSLVQFAGVFSGSLQVVVPNNAVTGKVVFRDSVSLDRYQATFFIVVHNPAVALGLNGIPQPLCSNDDTITLSGFPSGGFFSAYYLNNPLAVPSLILGNQFLLTNISSYDSLSSNRQVLLTYTYVPTYSNGQGSCPAVVDSLLTLVNTVELDSVSYSPISETESNVPLALLTRLVWPLNNRNFPSHYIGTYVTQNNLQANTIPFNPLTAPSATDTVIFNFSNGICQNSLETEIEVWKRPTILDSIPVWICQNADTIRILRNTNGLQVIVGSQSSGFSDANYVYQLNQVTDTLNFAYDEYVNKMTLSSSGGGLNVISNTPGFEIYDFIPAAVIGTSTQLEIKFDYERYTSFYTPTPSNPVTQYTIAKVQKLVNIEIPVNAQINTIITSDSIFCQDNISQQFTGIPGGGQYLIDNRVITANIFNPNYWADSLGVGNHTLVYVFTGNACTSSDTSNIVLPAVYSVTISSANGPEYCREDAPDQISVIASNQGVLDNAAAVFIVNTVFTGSIFNPRVAPVVIGSNQVIYIARDTFGCSASDTANFIVHPMPLLAMDTFQSRYCLNDPSFGIDLYEQAINQPAWTSSQGYTVPNIQVSLTGRGVVPSGINPLSPVYDPSVAGYNAQNDTITYTYTNTLTGCSATLQRVTFIDSLPIVRLETDSSGFRVGLQSFYCENRDTILVYGYPDDGNGILRRISNTQGFSNFDTTQYPGIFIPFVNGFVNPSETEIIAYQYTDTTTGCVVLESETITIRNITSQVQITGLPDSTCAQNTQLNLGTSVLGTAVSNGAFFALFPLDSSMITTAGTFSPDSSGVRDRGRNVYVVYSFSSNGCDDIHVYDTCYIKPMPQLVFFTPGARLFNSLDTTYHICFSSNPIRLIGLDLYEGGIYPLITGGPTDSLFTGFGVSYNPSDSGYYYTPSLASNGLDTITLHYTNILGCEGRVIDSVYVDTLPPLSFVGFNSSQYRNADSTYVYCSNDPSHLVIPNPFGGMTYLNFQIIPSVIFELNPDSLLQNGQMSHYRLGYHYIAARYANGTVCMDSTYVNLEIRPIPQLTLGSNLGDYFCLRQVDDTIRLFASPSGGIFSEITTGVLGGIRNIDTFTCFIPSAQIGERIITYSYTDTSTQCSNTLFDTIDVYNEPRVNFLTAGGCIGDSILFRPEPTGLDDVYYSLDSISLIIWNYGDGRIDSISQLNDKINVPQRYHVYQQSGVFFPTLTVYNDGRCFESQSRRIVISPKISVTDTTPYLQDFLTGPSDWYQENGDLSIALPQDSLWQWGFADGQRITTVLDANPVWKTNLDGVYNQGDNAWVYSPCFDISSLRRPMVALDIWRDSREGVDGTVLQYLAQPDSVWRVLGKRDKGLAWYNPSYVISAPGEQAGTPLGWSGTSTSWEDARYRLDVVGGDLRNKRNLRFRVAFASSPNTVVGNLEGFAFDNFFVGNRTRSVLLEHFTNQSFPGIATIERKLYDTIYDNLYGRDLSLIQFHTEYNSFDLLHQQAQNVSNSRVLYYGINNSNQIRINGQSFINRTSELIPVAPDTVSHLELLDMQMLQDARFKIKLYPVQIQNGNLTVTADITALQDISADDYAFHVVVTEDSITAVQGHKLMSVVRNMLPDASGTDLPDTWVTGDLIQHSFNWNFGAININYKPAQLKVVVFVQNRNTKEVYQVSTSRNLNAYNGPLPNGIDQVPMEDGAEILDVNLFPNPTQDGFTADFNRELVGNYEWRLMDILGRVLQRGELQAGTKSVYVNTENYSPGFYIFSANNESVYVQRKLVIER